MHKKVKQEKQMPKKVSELQSRLNILQSSLNTLLSQGQYLSNICYNLAQDSRLDAEYKKMIEKHTGDWDKAREEYRQEIKNMEV